MPIRVLYEWSLTLEYRQALPFLTE